MKNLKRYVIKADGIIVDFAFNKTKAVRLANYYRNDAYVEDYETEKPYHPVVEIVEEEIK